MQREKSDWGKLGCWPGNITLVCVSKCRTYAYHGTGKYDCRKLYCMGILCGQIDARRSIQHSDVICDGVLQRNMSKSLMWQFLVPLRLHPPSLRVTLAILLWAGLPRFGAFPFLSLKTGTTTLVFSFTPPCSVSGMMRPTVCAVAG